MRAFYDEVERLGVSRGTVKVKSGAYKVRKTKLERQEDSSYDEGESQKSVESSKLAEKMVKISTKIKYISRKKIFIPEKISR